MGRVVRPPGIGCGDSPAPNQVAQDRYSIMKALVARISYLSFGIMAENTDNSEITRLLRESVDGSSEARDRVLALVYDELHRQARMQRRQQRAYETLNTTALVHETFLRLWNGVDPGWQDRIHFFRVAARAMRNVLVDYARRRRAAKRGGGVADLPIEAADELPEVRDDEILAVHDALARLEELDPRQGKVVELRYFAGLSVPETAEVLDISPATVKREWATARVWLQREIERAR